MCVHDTHCMHAYICTYSYIASSLLLIFCYWQKKVNITNGLDGSATNYTVVYSDTSSETICYSTTLPASACGSPRGICKHVQNFPLSSCPQPIGIRMSVYGTNVVRSGPPSNTITVGRSTQELLL